MMTITQVAKSLNVPVKAAHGLIDYLRAVKAVDVGGLPNPGQRGRRVQTFQFTRQTYEALFDLGLKLPIDSLYTATEVDDALEPQIEVVSEVTAALAEVAAMASDGTVEVEIDDLTDVQV